MWDLTCWNKSWDPSSASAPRSCHTSRNGESAHPRKCGLESFHTTPGILTVSWGSKVERYHLIWCDDVETGTHLTARAWLGSLPARWRSSILPLSRGHIQTVASPQQDGLHLFLRALQAGLAGNLLQLSRHSRQETLSKSQELLLLCLSRLDWRLNETLWLKLLNEGLTQGYLVLIIIAAIAGVKI